MATVTPATPNSNPAQIITPPAQPDRRLPSIGSQGAIELLEGKQTESWQKRLESDFKELSELLDPATVQTLSRKIDSIRKGETTVPLVFTHEFVNSLRKLLINMEADPEKNVKMRNAVNEALLNLEKLRNEHAAIAKMRRELIQKAAQKTMPEAEELIQAEFPAIVDKEGLFQEEVTKFEITCLSLFSDFDLPPEVIHFFRTSATNFKPSENRRIDLAPMHIFTYLINGEKDARVKLYQCLSKVKTSIEMNISLVTQKQNLEEQKRIEAKERQRMLETEIALDRAKRLQSEVDRAMAS